MLILIEALFYLNILFLAYACIQTANAMDVRTSCKCTRLSLILIIAACAALPCVVIYNLGLEILLLALSLLISGFSLWLVVSNPKAHEVLDSAFSRFIKMLPKTFSKKAN